MSLKKSKGKMKPKSPSKIKSTVKNKKKISKKSKKVGLSAEMESLQKQMNQPLEQLSQKQTNPKPFLSEMEEIQYQGELPKEEEIRYRQEIEKTLPIKRPPKELGLKSPTSSSRIISPQTRLEIAQYQKEMKELIKPSLPQKFKTEMLKKPEIIVFAEERKNKLPYSINITITRIPILAGTPNALEPKRKDYKGKPINKLILDGRYNTNKSKENIKLQKQMNSLILKGYGLSLIRYENQPFIGMYRTPKPILKRLIDGISEEDTIKYVDLETKRNRTVQNYEDSITNLINKTKLKAQKISEQLKTISTKTIKTKLVKGFTSEIEKNKNDLLEKISIIKTSISGDSYLEQKIDVARNDLIKNMDNIKKSISKYIVISKKSK